MALTIGHDAMSSNLTRHTARLLPGQDRWEVSWLPGRTLSRGQALAAMELADATFCADMLDPGRDKPWGYIRQWAAELGMTPHEALYQADNPPARAAGAQPRHPGTISSPRLPPGARNPGAQPQAGTGREPDGWTVFWKALEFEPEPFPLPELDRYDLEAGE